MGFYENHILPRIIVPACSTNPILKQREKIVPQAKGRVLEVGMGSAINLPFYNADNVEMVWGLEPSEGMRLKAAPRLLQAPFLVEWLGLPGEEIPLDDNAADTVLLTFTLCTIPDFAKALEQMRRVLKPGGTAAILELAPHREAWMHEELGGRHVGGGPGDGPRGAGGNEFGRN